MYIYHKLTYDKYIKMYTIDNVHACLGQLQNVHAKLILTKFHSKNFNGFFKDYRGHVR